MVSNQAITEYAEAKLNSVNRDGISELIIYLKSIGYFTKPSSTKFHGNYEGGLVEHCLQVYNLFRDMILRLDVNIDSDSVIIVSFLHDLCKAEQYEANNNGYSYNAKIRNGHAKYSVELIEKYIKLTQEEKEIILYHMGMYGTKQFNTYSGEYDINTLVEVYNRNKLAKLFYFCDDMSAQFLEKNKLETE
jgi:putative nucleotidyltransferase with HDIG domain